MGAIYLTLIDSHSTADHVDHLFFFENADTRSNKLVHY